MFAGKVLNFLRFAAIATLLGGVAAMPALLARGDGDAPTDEEMDEGGAAVASDQGDEAFPASPSRPNPFRRPQPPAPQPPAEGPDEQHEDEPASDEPPPDPAPEPDSPDEGGAEDAPPERPAGRNASRRPLRPLEALDPYADSDETALEDETGAVPPEEEADDAEYDAGAEEANRDAETDSAAPSAETADATAAPPAVAEMPRAAAVYSAELNGVRPGVSTMDEVEAAWGLPREVGMREGLSEQVYAIEPFERVTATFLDDVVASIVVDLIEPFDADAVAREMALDGFKPVTVVDENGETLGRAYPERGVLFGFSPARPRDVVQVILDQISAEPFVLRAERGLDERYAGGLADLDEALRQDPKHARAQWLRAVLLGRVGRYEEALRAAWAAVRREPRKLEYRLTLAKVMEQTGDYASAAEELGRVLAVKNIDAALAARAHVQLGEVAANGPGRDLHKAVEHYLQALRLGQQAAAASLEDPTGLQAALLDAHLALAYAIAWGNWRDKPATIGQWLDRAAELVEVAPAERADALRFRVATQALAAYVGLQGEVASDDWGDEVSETGLRLIAAADDPLRRRQLEWELGLALYDCLQLDHLRGEYDAALAHGQAAVEHLERGKTDRGDSPGYAYLMGRLYFRLGVIHAIHRQDHRAAVAWFKKASPLIEQPVEREDGGDIGRQGESFVSMAVSYWETGDRKEAARLTVQGVELMEQAVEEGLLEDDALSVAYGNLSFMYDQLGDADAAKRYEELAVRPGAEVK